MADFADIAAEASTKFRDAALMAHASKPRPSGCASLACCQDCDEPIPEARRKAEPGCTRCTACQELEDKLSRSTHRSTP